MSEATRALVAWATTEGDPELLIAETADDGTFGADDVVGTLPLLVDPETGGFSEDLDGVLAGMGYRRVGEWTLTHDGGNATVVRA